MPKPNLSRRLMALGAAALLIAVDQLFKLLARNALAPESSRALLPGVLGLRYTENTGISFSLLGDSRVAMLVVSAITGLALLAGVVLMLTGKVPGIALIGASMILAGGAGNLVDRVFQGYVIDYIEFLFVKFAIFNFADVLIICGVAVVAVWVLLSERKRPVKP